MTWFLTIVLKTNCEPMSILDGDCWFSLRTFL